MSVHLEAKARPLLDPPIMGRAAVDSLRKLNPRSPGANPVMLIVEVGALLTTVLAVQALVGQGEAPAGFIIAIAAWLWFTVIFANFAEAMAEGRGKAQADNAAQGAARRHGQETEQPKPQRQLQPTPAAHAAQR